MTTDTYWKPVVGEYVRLKTHLWHIPGASPWKKADEMILAGTYMMVRRSSPGPVAILTFPNRKRWEVPAQIHDLERLDEPLVQIAIAARDWEEYDRNQGIVAEAVCALLATEDGLDPVVSVAEELRRLRDENESLKNTRDDLQKQLEPCTRRSGRCWQHDD